MIIIINIMVNCTLAVDFGIKYDFDYDKRWYWYSSLYFFSHLQRMLKSTYFSKCFCYLISFR